VLLMSTSIFPEDHAGGLPIRDGQGNPTFPQSVEQAYPPKPEFISTCPITALPSDCTARIEPRQLNAIVSELVAFAECLDPDGPWNCDSLQNLCTAFTAWQAANQHLVTIDGVSIIGTGTVADPFRVGDVDCGSY
jgi:hypothetical protein